MPYDPPPLVPFKCPGCGYASYHPEGARQCYCTICASYWAPKHLLRIRELEEENQRLREELARARAREHPE